MTLFITLFGSFSIAFDARPLPPFRTSKVQALCAYLIMEAPTVHQREALMELLWPGLPLRSAQVNLRQIIYQLSNIVPDVNSPEEETDIPFLLRSQKSTIQLNPAYPVQTDVGEFQERLRRSQRHSHSDLVACRQCQEWLAEAVALYQGDFLADFSLVDSNVYEAWSQAKREGLRRQLLDTLDTLTLMQLSANDHPAAEASARRQLEIDPYRESATWQLMRILALTGRRNEAPGSLPSVRPTTRRRTGDGTGA